MEEITMLMMILTIALFVVRYVIRKSGVDFLSAIMGLCSTIQILQDETIPDNQLLLMLMPMFLIVLLTFVHLMFSNKSDSY